MGFTANATVTFAATFAGVFIAQMLADSARRATDLAQFNSLYRVMAQDCERTLANVKQRPATTSWRLRADYSPPSFTWSSAYNNLNILSQIDFERMSKLAEEIQSAEAAYHPYSAALNDFNYAYPEGWEKQSPPDELIRYWEAKTNQEDKATAEKGGPYDPRNVSYIVYNYPYEYGSYEEYKAAFEPRRLEVERLKSQYVDALQNTCSIFFDLVQKS